MSTLGATRGEKEWKDQRRLGMGVGGGGHGFHPNLLRDRYSSTQPLSIHPIGHSALVSQGDRFPLSFISGKPVVPHAHTCTAEVGEEQSLGKKLYIYIYLHHKENSWL